jgi:hypothetical protein
MRREVDWGVQICCVHLTYRLAGTFSFVMAYIVQSGTRKGIKGTCHLTTYLGAICWEGLRRRHIGIWDRWVGEVANSVKGKRRRQTYFWGRLSEFKDDCPRQECFSMEFWPQPTVLTSIQLLILAYANLPKCVLSLPSTTAGCVTVLKICSDLECFGATRDGGLNVRLHLTSLVPLFTPKKRLEALFHFVCLVGSLEDVQ